MRDFEKKVCDELFDCVSDVLSKKIAVAVSGGADSVSLLISLCNIFSPLGIGVRAITVNHNIRPKKETCGDVDFVENLCERLKSSGKITECFAAQIPEGAVSEFACKRKRGIEEAARFLRYKAFSDFCRENEIDVLCLAHNKNDNLETILMRFLQGGTAQSLGGILRARNLSEKTTICRPLLNVERFEIEKYLEEGGFSWRTDATNRDVKYLRNKIRLKLIPFLNDEFPEWKNAVLNAAGKNRDDAEIFDAFLKKIPFEVGNRKSKSERINCRDDFADFSREPCDFFNSDNFSENAVCADFSETGDFCDARDFVKIRLKDFLPLENALKIRVIIKAMNMLGENRRVSSAFVKDLIDAILKAVSRDDAAFCESNPDFTPENKINFSKNFGNIRILCKKDCIFFKKSFKNHTDLFFFDIIEKSGTFYFPFGELRACENEKKSVSVYINDCFCCENLSFPFAVRSAVCGDVVKTADGGEKKVSDIFSDFHIGEDDKKFIPIVQSLQNFQPIICVLGNFLGYKNWIVKNI